MEFFAYHRDRAGSTPLRAELTEEHWSYMDRYELVARGPAFIDDDTLTGSVHVDVPDAAAARAFLDADGTSGPRCTGGSRAAGARDGRRTSS